MTSTGFTVIHADDMDDVYDRSDVPGEFRPLTDALGSEQVAITLIRIPPHSDFEQGTGHKHATIEELYLVTRGTLTMRFDEWTIPNPPRSMRSGPPPIYRLTIAVVRMPNGSHPGQHIVVARSHTKGVPSCSAQVARA